MQLYTWGSEGDVRPFFALARGLKAAGHEVRLAYVAIDGRDWTPLAQQLGLEARRVAVEELARARAAVGEAFDALVTKDNPLRQIDRVLTHLLDPAAEAMWRDAEEHLRGCDVVVSHALHHAALALAVARGSSLVTVQPAPVLPTRHLPPVGAPSLGPLNGLLWRLAELLGGRWFLPRINAARARAGLAPSRAVFPNPNPEVALGFTCVSPTLVPRPSDWEPTQRVPGFFELPADAQGWSAPLELEAFLAQGEPPVLMTFGSMLAVASEETRRCVEVFFEAARLSGRRALVQAPWAELADLEAPPGVFRLGRAPHSALLPRCAAMVHHGGAGTTHTAALAGRCSVVVPFLGDQFFWAQRLRALGVAPAALPRPKLSGPALAQRLRDLAADKDAPARARALGEAMAREDGVAQAVRWLGELPPRRAS